jgi:dTDP-glucose 4,6-dehydratase
LFDGFIFIFPLIAKELGKEPKFEFIDDRPAHDVIYAIDSSKIRTLGWIPFVSLEDGVKNLAYWYKNNMDWLESNKYKNQEWLDEQYGK